MFEVFKTVFLLSCFGAILIVLLVILKPFTVKRFPAVWQCAVWITVAVFMLLPVWKLIPQDKAQIITTQLAVDFIIEENTEENIPHEYFVTEDDAQSKETTQDKNMDYVIVAAYIWIAGVIVFLTIAVISYTDFCIKKRKNSTEALNNRIFEEVKSELKIKRHIRVRISDDIASPMLVGCIFPVVYVPSYEMESETERLIYRHELTHYKHKDLLLKWFTLFVNAVHWFNPLAYMLSANVSQSCEISCDMSVVKNLNSNERDRYMNTILDLLGKQKGR